MERRVLSARRSVSLERRESLVKRSVSLERNGPSARRLVSLERIDLPSEKVNIIKRDNQTIEVLDGLLSESSSYSLPSESSAILQSDKMNNDYKVTISNYVQCKKVSFYI